MITVSTNVFCDFCPSWVFGVTGIKMESNLARSAAKTRGWIRIKIYGQFKDKCPGCQGLPVRSTDRLGLIYDGEYGTRR